VAVSAGFFTEVPGQTAAVLIIPREITEHGEDRIPPLEERDTVFVVVAIVWLALPPVEPLHSGVVVGPPPGPGMVFTVLFLSSSSYPPLISLLRVLFAGEEHVLEEVVDPRVVRLSSPPSM